MTPSRGRAPLSDLSNSSLTSSPAGRPASKPFNSRLVNAKGAILQRASPSLSEPHSDGGGQEAADGPDSVCQTPPSTASMSMEVDSTPRGMETNEPRLSSKEGSFIIYSRRKTADPLHFPMSCPPPRHRLKESKNLMDHADGRKAVKRGFSTAMLSGDGGSKGPPKRSRRHSLPNLHPKQWLPEEFVAAQRSHFAEVDAFQLLEEEGELSDEG